jgi:hypothetical protein
VLPQLHPNGGSQVTCSGKTVKAEAYVEEQEYTMCQAYQRDTYAI